MEKLLVYLEQMGIYPDPNKSQAVAFEDAIVRVSMVDGIACIDVEMLDEVHVMLDSLEDIVADEFELEFAEDNDLDWFDEALGAFMNDVKFNINSVVTVKGYEGRVFEVGGIGRSETDGVFYDLIDLDNDDMVTAFEEDMEFYKAQPKTNAKLLVGGMLKGIVDELLDRYNDYKDLYEKFGDEEYKERMDATLVELEKIKL